MAAVATAQTPNTTSKSNGPRRRKLIGQRRRVEDDEGGDDEGSHGAVDLVDDDSMSEGSVASDDNDAAGNSDTSNIDEASPTSPVVRKGSASKGQGGAHGNGMAKSGPKQPAENAKESASTTIAAAADVKGAEAKMGDLSISDDKAASADQQGADNKTVDGKTDGASTPAPQQKASQPAVVSSASAQAPRRETAYERQRREHDLYKQKRDEDPSFVPNRGAFFMHDHRGAGPSANGFRPFGRPARGRGRGGFAGGPFAPVHNQQMHNPADPTINGPWTHDMHEAVTGRGSSRMPMTRRSNYDAASQHGGTQAAIATTVIPTCPPSTVPINRSMSVEKPLGTITVRVFFPPMKAPVLFEKFTMVQYTKLPDHRPPLRRDKAVIIDLPGHPKRQIFPATDRSFIFIPRALRPNQQRLRGSRTRSVMGSISGFSRRTSMFGGSYYNGSIYTPSVAMSRRSSIVAADMANRDFIISPTGSAISRPPMAPDNVPRPVVRLPPPTILPPNPAAAMIPHPGMAVPVGPVPIPAPPLAYAHTSPNAQPGPRPLAPVSYPQPSLHPQGSVPPPENQSLPPKPPIPQNRPSNSLPMHQPRPQKAVSVKTIEPQPTSGYGPSPQQQPYSMPFHQQVPIQMASGYPPGEGHSRHPSYPSHTTGTPLSQIPERAIHAAPFQPTQGPQVPSYPQTNASTPSGPGFYGAPNTYPMMQPPPPQQGYYYPTPPNFPTTMATTGGAPSFVASGTPQGQGPAYGQPGQVEPAGTPAGGRQAIPGHSLVAQEVNGMVYYIDPTQVAGVPSYASYTPAPPPAAQGGYMPGMVTPNPTEGFYYTPQPGVVYYPQ